MRTKQTVSKSPASPKRQRSPKGQGSPNGGGRKQHVLRSPKGGERRPFGTFAREEVAYYQKSDDFEITKTAIENLIRDKIGTRQVEAKAIPFLHAVIENYIVEIYKNGHDVAKFAGLTRRPAKTGRKVSLKHLELLDTLGANKCCENYAI